MIMRYKFSHEHIIYVKYKNTAAQCNIKHNRLEPNYANVVLKIIKLYINCAIIAVVMGIILSIMGYLF